MFYVKNILHYKFIYFINYIRLYTVYFSEVKDPTSAQQKIQTTMDLRPARLRWHRWMLT